MIEVALAKSKGRVAGHAAEPPNWYTTVDVGVEDQTVKDRK
jgi:hypothetical protein